MLVDGKLEVVWGAHSTEKLSNNVELNISGLTRGSEDVEAPHLGGHVRLFLERLWSRMGDLPKSSQWKSHHIPI